MQILWPHYIFSHLYGEEKLVLRTVAVTPIYAKMNKKNKKKMFFYFTPKKQTAWNLDLTDRETNGLV